MDWLEDLGLGGEEKNIVDYLATLSASEQRTYLSSLLPETRHPFIEDIINHFHRGQTKKVTKESPSASSSVNKTCNESKSVLKFGKARALDDPHMKSSPKLTYITGNEEGISTSELKNCLECGMIYHFKAYNELSHCSFCENPLGKSQKKRAMNKSVSELEDLRAMELRDKLLQYDVTCAERTKVYDDHEDYYELDSSVWSSNLGEPVQPQPKTKEDDREQLVIDFSAKRVMQHDKGLDGKASQIYDNVAKSLS